jgi:hypothetical protein
MKPIKTMPVDYNTCVKYRGQHREVHWEISCHAFRAEPSSMWDFPCGWATYVVLSPEQHEKFLPRLESAPWNGGQTYYRKEWQEHIGISPELKERWDRPYFKMGDDFMHLWDHERIDLYDREYMERHIKRVIDFLHDGESEDRP